MTKQIILVFLTIMMLFGCEAMQTKEQVSKLDSALQLYEKALRWAEYRAAANFHVSREEIPLVVDIEHAKKFNVTGINIIEKTLNPEITEALILAEINYYDREYGTIKQLRQEQHWWRVPDENVWLIESDFPQFK